MLRTIILCLCLTAIVFTQEEGEAQAEDPQTSIEGANFEGHFDSMEMNGPGVSVQPEEDEGSEEIDSTE
jgi:hypothetical protein